jgi:colanic acid biosynthesis glycosyl transferase WcaI
MRIFIHDYAGHPFQFELSRELARRGHVVRHAYFAGDQGPKGETARSADDPEGLSVLPIDLGVTYSKTNLIRRHRLDGRYGRLAAAALAQFEPDVALVANTPLNALRTLQTASAHRGTWFALWLQDSFGLAAAALLKDRWGGVGRLASAYYQASERDVLRRVDQIIAISEDFIPYLRRVGVAADRIAVIPNWGPLSGVGPRPKDNDWSTRHGLQGKLVFAYTGTLGLKHNPQLLYALAQSFGDRSDVIVQVASKGVGADWLRAQPPLPQLQLLPIVPMDQLADAYGAADVLIAILEAEASAFSAPSKVLAYLCAGRTVLLSAPSQNIASRVLEASGGGVVTVAGDVAAFLAAARGLAEAPDQRGTYSTAGRAYALRAFDIVRVADDFEAQLTIGRRPTIFSSTEFPNGKNGQF